MVPLCVLAPSLLSETPIATEDLPVAVIETIAESFPGLIILSVEIETEGGGRECEAKILCRRTILEADPAFEGETTEVDMEEGGRS